MVNSTEIIAVFYVIVIMVYLTTANQNHDFTLIGAKQLLHYMIQSGKEKLLYVSLNINWLHKSIIVIL